MRFENIIKNMKKLVVADAKYRSKPFWAWNSKLEKEELKRQIEIFKEMGFGGFFMHSRTGLETEYMSDEWCELVNYCARVASDLGMEAYLYDEDRYPSGTCGGYAVADPDCRAKYLAIAQKDAADFDPDAYENTVAVFCVTVADGRLLSYKKYSGETSGSIAVFYTGVCEPESAYNGNSYLDTLNKKAVENFIGLTHERYKELCGENFGKKIFGIFSDEVSFGSIFREELEKDFWRDTRIPYTGKLFGEFEKKYGYDLKDRLPELFFASADGGPKKIMWQFVELLQCMFIENFAKPYHDWCKKNNLKFCGHILQEETLIAQSVRSGSVMRFYEYMDYPGVDVLCENGGNEWKIKQAVSVCKQLGKEHTLSECFGATGWSMDFERYKKIFDQGAVYGINFRVPHLSWYTMEGRGKRDYPASISFQSGWYKEFSYCEDYFARTEYLLDRGKYVTDVCVLSPVESVWSLLYKDGVTGEASFVSAADETILKIEKTYADTFYALTDCGVDFDYADEDILIRKAEIVCDEKGCRLAIGNMEYYAVVVSGSITVRRKTHDILSSFAERGGTVVINGGLEYIDFEKAEKNDRFIYADGCDALCETVKNSVKTVLNVPQGVLYNLRKTEDGYVLFAVNGENNIGSCEIELGELLHAGEVDLRTGEFIKAEYSVRENSVAVKTDFSPRRERMFIFTQTPPEVCDKRKNSLKLSAEIPLLLDYTLSEENVMVLDRVSLEADGKIFTENEYVLTADARLRRFFGVKERDEMMIQPWFRNKFDGEKYSKTLAELSVTYSFNVESAPEEMFLCLEQSELYEIYVNGTKIAKNDKGFWIDACFDRLAVPSGLIKKGINHVRLKGNFSEKSNLECVYLLGKFGVSRDGKTIGKLPEKLSFGDVCAQGLPFYSGKIVYHTGIKSGKYSVKFNESNGACQQVSFGSVTETVPFSPYETAETELDGELCLIVSLTRYNTFGPLHNKNIKAEWNGPFNYLDMHDGNYTEDFNFIKQGILTKPDVKKTT